MRTLKMIPTSVSHVNAFLSWLPGVTLIRDYGNNLAVRRERRINKSETSVEIKLLPTDKALTDRTTGEWVKIIESVVENENA